MKNRKTADTLIEGKPDDYVALKLHAPIEELTKVAIGEEVEIDSFQVGEYGGPKQRFKVYLERVE